jgi:hypothetical protein
MTKKTEMNCISIPDTLVGEMRRLANESIDQIEQTLKMSMKDFSQKKVRMISESNQVGKVKAQYYKDVGKLTGNTRMEKAVSLMQAGWNNDPCTSNGIAMQEAATCSFKGESKHGCQDVIHQPVKGSTETHQLGLTAEAVFAQEALKRATGKKEIEVYRGVRGIPPDTCLKMPVRPLSSWTRDREWAARVSGGAGTVLVAGGVVVKKNIPIDRVMAWSPVAEWLSEGEDEVIVLSENGYETICPENVESES